MTPARAWGELIAKELADDLEIVARVQLVSGDAFEGVIGAEVKMPGVLRLDLPDESSAFVAGEAIAVVTFELDRGAWNGS